MHESPVIVSRGYGSQPGHPNDEFLELQLHLPDTPHIQNPDRIAAVSQAIDRHNATSIVLDDGFQHRRLGRNLDIVLIDATCPFGYDHLLPRGLLREPVESLSRVDAVIITRVDQASEKELSRIRQRVAMWIDEHRIAHVSFPLHTLVNRTGETQHLNATSRIVGFCGIGNPDGFHRSLSGLDGKVVAFRSFADHYHYKQTDIDALQQLATEQHASALICTVKDFVKVKQLSFQLPILAATIVPAFESGKTMLRNLIERTLMQEHRTIP